MEIARAVPRFFLAITLLGALSACGSSDEKTTDAESPKNDSAPVQYTAKLYINELQPSNQDVVTDENGDTDDWIEIYNAGDTDADLKGYSVSDSGSTQIIPSSLLVPAGGFILLWADDSPPQGPAHLGFKLSATAGDSVTLKDPNGTQVDTVPFGVATGQNSYARFPDGTGVFAWCAAQTPKAANGATCTAP